ncbi:MAG: hypothetical protein KatS3mg031_1530 [Chitinophagales bacterium]|nr:MAG: hypothetical protein KatS3mg031_1530 [Chitinophagales bacterium]
MKFQPVLHTFTIPNSPCLMSENLSHDDYQDVLDLVAHFEEMEKTQGSLFLDESSFEQLIEYYEQKLSNDKAARVVDLAIMQYPYSAYFLIKKAQYFFDMRQFDQALELLERAEIYDPQDMQIYLLRSDIYVWMEDYKKAASSIERALSICEPEDKADLYLELADVYEEWEQYDQVFECLKKTLSYESANEEALNRLWFCVEFTEKYQESIQLHTALIEKDPYNYLAWFNLAHAYSGVGEYEKAVEAFEFVIAINEEYEYAYKDCGDVLFKMEEYRKAIEFYRNGLDASRPSKEILFNIAECYEAMEEYAKARNYYRKALNLDPQFHEALFRIGMCYQAEEKWSNAVLSFERCVRIKDDDPDYLEALADCYYEQGDLDSAMELYHKVLDIRPGVKETWLSLARTMMESGIYAEAFRLLDEASEEFDAPADILYVKSAYHYLLGNKKESLLNLEHALLKDKSLYAMLFDIAPLMEADFAVQQVINQYS